MKITDKINFKQPKYILPAIIYLPLLGTMYFVFDIFDTELAEVTPTELETTEYLNDKMPTAQISDELGGKYENMLKSYGKIEDYSAVENIERGEEDDTEDYDSKYTDDDLAALEADAAKRLAELEGEGIESRLRQSQRRGESMVTDSVGVPLSEEDRLARSKKRQDEALEELNKALAQARLAGQKGMDNVTDAATDIANGADTLDTSRNIQGRIEVNERVVSQPSEDAAPNAVVKKIRTNSDYFNTLAENESEPRLIKAIIDEDIQCVDGSRVRLRLLDDIEINEVTLSKGSYLYSEMNGFGSQRVKGDVSSILVNDELVKVSLTIYDTDGLEGLYVPKSSFRETVNDVASSAMSGSMSVNESSNNTFTQWGVQAINNAYQRTANAIAKNIKKNKAKLKYGTFVYLVNSQDKKN